MATAGSGSGSGWAGIFGSIFGGGDAATPNIHNFSESQQNQLAEDVSKSNRNEDKQEDRAEDEEEDLRTQNFEEPTDQLTFSDELMEEMEQPKGKKPTSVWPPRKS